VLFVYLLAALIFANVFKTRKWKIKKRDQNKNVNTFFTSMISIDGRSTALSSKREQCHVVS